MAEILNLGFGLFSNHDESDDYIFEGNPFLNGEGIENTTLEVSMDDPHDCLVRQTPPIATDEIFGKYLDDFGYSFTAFPNDVCEMSQPSQFYVSELAPAESELETSEPVPDPAPEIETSETEMADPAPEPTQLETSDPAPEPEAEISESDDDVIMFDPSEEVLETYDYFAPEKRAREEDECVPPAKSARLHTVPLHDFSDVAPEDDLHGPGFTAFVQQHARNFGVSYEAMRQRVSNILMGSTTISSKPGVPKSRSPAFFMSGHFGVSSQKNEILDSCTLWRVGGETGPSIPMMRSETAGLGEIHITIHTFYSAPLVVPVVAYLRAIAEMHRHELHPGAPTYNSEDFEGLAFFRGVLDGPQADQFRTIQMPAMFDVPAALCRAHAVPVHDGQVARACSASRSLVVAQWMQRHLEKTHAHVRPKISIHVLDHMLVFVGAPIEIFKMQLLLVANTQRSLTYVGRARNTRFRQTKTHIVLDVTRIAAAVMQWCALHGSAPGARSLLIAAFWLAFSAFDAPAVCKIATSETVDAVYWRIRGCQTAHDARTVFETTFLRKGKRSTPVQQAAPGNWRHAHGAVSCICERDGVIDRLLHGVCSDGTCACRIGGAPAPAYAWLGDIPCLSGVSFDECVMISLPEGPRPRK